MRMLSGRWRSRRSAKKFSLLSSIGTATSKVKKMFATQIGESASRVSTVYATTFDGTATAANWSDLAERYHADSDDYDEGTVLAIGGENEVTLYKSGLPLAGVVYDKPGFQLNTNEDRTNRADWPFVCLKGRVPVKITESVKKGDFIIADDNGLAISNGTHAPIERDKLIGIALADSIGLTVEVKI